MFNKLEAFALSRDSKKTRSSLMERFKFFRKEKHRDKCLEQLRLWNERCIVSYIELRLGNRMLLLYQNTRAEHKPQGSQSGCKKERSIAVQVSY